MPEDIKVVAQTYFESWKNEDFDTLRSILADDVTFAGPLGQASNADECIAGLTNMAKIKTDIVVRTMCADGDDVITWFDLHTATTDPLPVANWSHVTESKITRIRVTFDPRPILPPTGT
jgi:hypothetical protein